VRDTPRGGQWGPILRERAHPRPPKRGSGRLKAASKPAQSVHPLIVASAGIGVRARFAGGLHVVCGVFATGIEGGCIGIRLVKYLTLGDVDGVWARLGGIVRPAGIGLDVDDCRLCRRLGIDDCRPCITRQPPRLEAQERQPLGFGQLAIVEFPLPWARLEYSCLGQPPAHLALNLYRPDPVSARCFGVLDDPVEVRQPLCTSIFQRRYDLGLLASDCLR